MKPRLLDRISEWERQETETGDVPPMTTPGDLIRQHLEKILNTRKGTVLIDEDFGLADFSAMLNGYSAPDVDFIVQQLYFQCKKYEPRLDAVQVKFMQQSQHPEQLMFGISGSINDGAQKQSIGFNALLADDGSVTLNSEGG